MSTPFDLLLVLLNGNTNPQLSTLASAGLFASCRTIPRSLAGIIASPATLYEN
jgi:hypothetical protein